MKRQIVWAVLVLVFLVLVVLVVDFVRFSRRGGIVNTGIFTEVPQVDPNMADVVVLDDDGGFEWVANEVAEVQGPFTYDGSDLAYITYGSLTFGFAIRQGQGDGDPLIVGDTRFYVRVLQQCDENGEAVSPAAYVLEFADGNQTAACYGGRAEDGLSVGAFTFQTTVFNCTFRMATRQDILLQDGGTPQEGKQVTAVCALSTVEDGDSVLMWWGDAAEDDAAIPLTDASGETTWITPCGQGARGQWNGYGYYRGDPRTSPRRILSAEIHYLGHKAAVTADGSVTINVQDADLSYTGFDAGATADGITVLWHGNEPWNWDSKLLGDPTTSRTEPGRYLCAGSGVDGTGKFVRLPVVTQMSAGETQQITVSAKTYQYAGGASDFWVEAWCYDSTGVALAGLTVSRTYTNIHTSEVLVVSATTDANGYAFASEVVDARGDWTETTALIISGSGVGWYNAGGIGGYGYTAYVLVLRPEFLVAGVKWASREHLNIRHDFTGYTLVDIGGEGVTCDYVGTTDAGRSYWEPLQPWDSVAGSNDELDYEMHDANGDNVMSAPTYRELTGADFIRGMALTFSPDAAPFGSNVLTELPPQGTDYQPSAYPDRTALERWLTQYCGDPDELWNLHIYQVGLEDTDTEGIVVESSTEVANPEDILLGWDYPSAGAYTRGFGITNPAQDGRLFAAGPSLPGGLYQTRIVALGHRGGYISRLLEYFWSPDIEGWTQAIWYEASTITLATWNAGSYEAGTDLPTDSNNWSPVARAKLNCTVAPSSALGLRITGQLADDSTETVDVTVSSTGEALIYTENPVYADGVASPYTAHHLWRGVTNIEWLSGPLNSGVVQVRVLPPLLLSNTAVKCKQQWSSLFMDRYPFWKVREPHFFEGPEGKLYCVFVFWGDVCLRRSDTLVGLGSDTDQHRVTSQPPCSHPWADKHVSGAIVCTYERNGGVKMKVSEDDGHTWSTEMAIVTGTKPRCEMYAGRLYMVYYDEGVYNCWRSEVGKPWTASTWPDGDSTKTVATVSGQDAAAIVKLVAGGHVAFGVVEDNEIECYLSTQDGAGAIRVS